MAIYNDQFSIVQYLQSQNQAPMPQGARSPSSNNMPLEFYEMSEPYYAFTNFYAGTPIVIGGKSWPTSEHYFQAMKFNDPLNTRRNSHNPYRS